MNERSQISIHSNSTGKYLLDFIYYLVIIIIDIKPFEADTQLLSSCSTCWFIEY